MIKKGDIVVCTDNKTYESYLTLNKPYEVTQFSRLQSGFETYDDYVTIINDDGKEYSYINTRFLLIKEWREKRLKEIGI